MVQKLYTGFGRFFLEGLSEMEGGGGGDCDLNSLKLRIANHIFYECIFLRMPLKFHHIISGDLDFSHIKK